MKTISITKIGHFTGHNDSIYALCNGHTTDTFFTGGADGMIVLWNTDKGNEGTLVARIDSAVYSLWVYDEDHLLAGTSSGNLYIIDLKQKKEIRNMQAHEKGVFTILATQKNTVITCGGDGKIKRWSWPETHLLQEKHSDGKSARCLAVHPGLQHLAAGYSDYSIRVFSLENLELITHYTAHSNSVFSLAYDQHRLFSGGRDALIKTWQADTNYRELQSINAHWFHVNHLAFSPDNLFFASASMDKTIKLWETSTCHLLKVLDKERYDAHTSSVNKIIWLDSTRFVSCSDDRTAQLFDIHYEH